jgi:hypothetical protein
VLFGIVVWTGGLRGFRPRRDSGRAGTLVLSLAAGLPLAAVISSSFWDLPTTWVMVAIFVVAGSLAASRYDEAATASDR